MDNGIARGFTVSEERETTGRCGWAALCLVMVLLFGLLPGSLAGGLAGLQFAEFFGMDHAFELGKRIFVLAGMIAGLLFSTLIVMAVTIVVISLAARFRRSFRSSRLASVLFLKE